MKKILVLETEHKKWQAANYLQRTEKDIKLKKSIENINRKKNHQENEMKSENLHNSIAVYI